MTTKAVWFTLADEAYRRRVARSGPLREAERKSFIEGVVEAYEMADETMMAGDINVDSLIEEIHRAKAMGAPTT